MRLNKYIAQATGMSRRAADNVIANSRVLVNGAKPTAGQDISSTDTVTLDNSVITPAVKTMTIMLNKPVGYVCSRNGQGGKTIYELLPESLHHLKPVGRLDKDSSGLLLLTNDGNLAHQLTHPSFQKEKVYQVRLNKPLIPEDKARLDNGVMLEDGLSNLNVILSEAEGSQSKTDHSTALRSAQDDRNYTVTMCEGRNRQIRRTFSALGYSVIKLHRTHFGGYKLGDLPSRTYRQLA